MQNHPDIAFYAPLKEPDHPTPSGDRMIARLLIKALNTAGFTVRLASRMSFKDMQGDKERQQRCLDLADKLAQRLLRQWQHEGYQPKLWFTYHLYYKAPDLLGPLVARELDIPYVLAEASWAPKREKGPWQTYHQRVGEAIVQSDRIFMLNPIDHETIAHLRGDSVALVPLPPFLDTQALPEPKISKSELAAQWNLNAQLPWIATLAMMRHGDKLASYCLLAEAFSQTSIQCQLLLIGDGPARVEVEQAFGDDPRVRFLGEMKPSHFFPLLYAARFHVWPAVNEAFGMNLLEAQWAGLPVIAGDEGGVSTVMQDGKTGCLTPPRNAKAIATSMNTLLENTSWCNQLQANCRPYIEEHHSMQAAAAILSSELKELL